MICKYQLLILQTEPFVIEEGAKVLVCGVCMKARGMSEEELISGCNKTTMNGFLDMCIEADNIIFC